jgi:glycosyltransferase involved in cell wall biosynthesis
MKSRKRVCIVKLGHYPELKHLVRDAEALLGEGLEVDVLCLRKKGEKARERVGDVNVYRLPGEHHRTSVPRYLFEYSYFPLASTLALAWLWLRRRYDVIEVCTMPDYLVFSSIVPRLLGAKVVLYFFENMAMLFASSYRAGSKNPAILLIKMFEKISAAYANRIIAADGMPYKKILIGHGVAGDKITVVMNVPDEEVFNINSVPAPTGDNGFRLMVVSTLTKRYGVQTLVKATPLLLKSIPNLSVDVVGGGEYQPRLEELARDLGVEKQIKFVGHVPHSEVPTYIGRADVCVAPMADDVGQPNKIFEYFALGKPTVASAHPTLLDTFDGESVLYFRPNDEASLAAKVLELYQNPDKRGSLARNGHTFYQGCKWQVMKEEYLQVYRDLLK